MNKMRLTAKFTLILSVVLVTLFLFTAYMAYQDQQKTARSMALDEARSKTRELIDIFNHMSEIVRDEPEDNYSLVPQVATTQIAQKLSAHGRYSIRQVALNYRNPANMPDEYEAEYLEKFSPGKRSEAYGIVERDGKKVFRYLHSLIADKSCLRCHGDYESAPAYIQERFPESHPSYDYEEGDVLGAVSFVKPMQPLYAEVAQNFRQELAYRAVIILLFVVVTYIVVHRLILKRIQMASATIHKITLTGSLHERIPETDSRDEIGQLLVDFNQMMNELERTTLQREESEERYRSLIEATRSAIVTFLDNGKIVISNHQAEQMIGLTREELLGESIFDYIDDGAGLQEQVKQLRDKDREQNHKIAGEYQIKNVKGQMLRVQIVLVLASDAVHQPMFTAILRDIENA
ncbi:MAG: c-type heme family protein [Desulfuromonadaceae bacterium]|jgi:PAS domain S-box-containing protein